MFGTKKGPKEVYVPEVKAPVFEPAPAEEPAPKIQRPHTLIGPGIKFVGNIEASEDIEINGRVEGNISSGNTITVTEEGSIRGDIAAENYILDGVSEGNAKIQKFCKIGSKGSFTGELFASTLVTEDGSEFEGMLHLKKAKAVPVIDFSQPAAESALPEEGGDVPATEENIFQ
jgi:cytoskeletal protein CcmA (bactofilin family)